MIKIKIYYRKNFLIKNQSVDLGDLNFSRILIVPQFITEKYDSIEKQIKCSMVFFKGRFSINNRLRILQNIDPNEFVELTKEDILNLNNIGLIKLFSILPMVLQLQDGLLFKKEIINFSFEIINELVNNSRIKVIPEILKRIAFSNFCQDGEFEDDFKIINYDGKNSLMIQRNKNKKEILLLRNKNIGIYYYYKNEKNEIEEVPIYNILFSKDFKKTIKWWEDNLDKLIDQEINNNFKKIKSNIFKLVLIRESILKGLKVLKEKGGIL